MAKRKRRAVTREFKAQAVRIVRESGKSVGVVARELDLTETALRSWVRQAEIDAGRGAPGAAVQASADDRGTECQHPKGREHENNYKNRHIGSAFATGLPQEPSLYGIPTSGT